MARNQTNFFKVHKMRGKKSEKDRILGIKRQYQYLPYSLPVPRQEKVLDSVRTNIIISVNKGRET